MTPEEGRYLRPTLGSLLIYAGWSIGMVVILSFVGPEVGIFLLWLQDVIFRL